MAQHYEPFVGLHCNVYIHFYSHIWFLRELFSFPYFVTHEVVLYA